MVFRVSACLLLSASGQDLFLEQRRRVTPLEGYRQVLKNSLIMHGVSEGQARATSNAWPGENLRARELPMWRAEDWHRLELPSYIHEQGFEVQQLRFTSPEIKLLPGEAHFTLNRQTHSPFPKGDYSIFENKYRVVQDDGSTEPSLAEVYLHHWLMGSEGSDTFQAPLEYCENDYYWGYGAEMRNMDYTIPEGFAFKRIGSVGHCGLNMHFIRVEDLKLDWKGLNNPNGSWGAAVKNCIECGYAPGRAPECTPELDGSFECCFTGSRCPTQGTIPEETKSYRLQYDIKYTEDMSKHKPLRMVVMDVSGGDLEWNVAANMKKAHNTECGDKACVTKDTWTVGEQKGFGDGICAGTMMWGYTHQHLGAINSSMFLNDKLRCTSYPKIGTDETNPAGNEKGFVVKFTNCVDSKHPVRLNNGDKLRIEAWYDVDKDSQVTAPLPGGKHGGVMDLFFGMMDCDPGTFGEIYVCRDKTCVPTFTGNVKEGPSYATIKGCQEACK